MMLRRGLLRCVGAMAVAGLLPGYAFALDYPIRAARVIVPSHRAAAPTSPDA